MSGNVAGQLAGVRQLALFHQKTVFPTVSQKNDPDLYEFSRIG